MFHDRASQASSLHTLLSLLSKASLANALQALQQQALVRTAEPGDLLHPGRSPDAA